MSAEQTEEPVAEPQSEEPKGLLKPSRVGIYIRQRLAPRPQLPEAC